ncbi:MAG: dimethylmenaquinone methyltransferase [Bryobacteraceae bacterium]
MKQKSTILFAAALLAAALPVPAQLWTLPPGELAKANAKSNLERFPDGRPKVSDALLAKLREMDIAIEDMVGQIKAAGYQSQFEGNNWKVLNPQKKLVGRAFTVQFMPSRPDLTEMLDVRGKLRNQSAIDMLQPGDVAVVDLFGKQEGGTFVGDKLAYYVWKTTGTGMVIDGSMFYLRNIEKTGMPAFYRTTHPSSLTGATLTGINIPVRIGGVTVMPGDVVFGDRDGVLFIPPHMVEKMVSDFEATQARFEWIKKKFDEGKWKSSDIYGRPKDPALVKEMEEYIKSRQKK